VTPGPMVVAADGLALTNSLRRRFTFLARNRKHLRTALIAALSSRCVESASIAVLGAEIKLSAASVLRPDRREATAEHKISNLTCFSKPYCSKRLRPAVREVCARKAEFANRKSQCYRAKRCANQGLARCAVTNSAPLSMQRC
jgi:hypothetical protein